MEAWSLNLLSGEDKTKTISILRQLLTKKPHSILSKGMFSIAVFQVFICWKDLIMLRSTTQRFPNAQLRAPKRWSHIAMKYHQRNRLTSSGNSHCHVILLLVGPNLCCHTCSFTSNLSTFKSPAEHSYMKSLMAGDSIFNAGQQYSWGQGRKPGTLEEDEPIRKLLINRSVNSPLLEIPISFCWL